MSDFSYPQLDIIEKIKEDTQREANDYIDRATQNPAQTEEYIKEMRIVLMSEAMGLLREETAVSFNSSEIYNLQQDVLEIIDGATREIRMRNMGKSLSQRATKDMSTLIEVAKLLGQIGTAGATMYVGAGAARESYDALKAKCREMMDKLEDAQRQLDDIDPRELDNEMRSAPNLNETKSFADIMNFLYAAGIVFVGGTMIWDRRDAIMGRIESAIDAFTEALTNLRYGSDMEDLQRSIDILRNAGVQVPDEIQAIANDPRNGDSTIAGVNIAYARGFLTEALHHLQEAQARAESMSEDKGDVIYGRFGSDSEDDGGEPGDVSDFFSQAVSEVEGTSTTLDNMYEAYVEWCQSRGCSPVPPEAFKREMLGMGIMRQYIAGRDRWLGVTLKSISVKAAGAHSFYR